MNKEKELIKKIIKYIVSFSTSSIIFLLILISSVIMCVYQIQNSNKFNGGNITDIGSLGVPYELVQHFNEASSIFNIPNWILSAVAKQESNFNPNTEYGGAYGLMQIQKTDISGIDLWSYLINNGLGDIYKNNGYSFSDSEEMWNIFLNDPKAQIFAGAYEIRYYTNYVLYKKGYTNKLDYNSNENMNLINWNSNENDSDFKELLRRIFACYNGGPMYGMNVNLDKAQHDYPNKVFKYAMEFRNTGLIIGDNELIEKAIENGMKWVGKSPYVWGGGRTEEDVQLGKFDCSSFVHYMYSSVGINLGDRASVVTFSLINLGQKINISDIKRGDLIFFNTYTTNGHVGVYLGNGQFIHDSPSQGVSIANLNNSYWKERFNGQIRRIIN